MNGPCHRQNEPDDNTFNLKTPEKQENILTSATANATSLHPCKLEHLLLSLQQRFKASEIAIFADNLMRACPISIFQESNHWS